MEILHEEWRAVKGLEGTHEVSNHGRVRRLARSFVYRGKPVHLAERLLSTKAGKGGYPVTRLGNTLRYVHHLVLEAFVGPRPAGYEGCHRNGIRSDNRPTNLRWGTPQSNQIDRVDHGTSNRGERCAAAKLTAAEAIEIYKSSEPGVVLARRFGISSQGVCNIRKGRIWSWLTTATAKDQP